MHYMLSVMSAFENRVCINFKDKAMQLFKSVSFAEEQQRIEDVFTQLPPPKPSGMKYTQPNVYQAQGGGGYGPARSASAPRDMTGYYNASGGCFSGDSLISAVDPRDGRVFAMKICELNRGVNVLSENGDITTVECVVKMNYTGLLYPIGSTLFLTAYHPVLVGDETFFPCEMCSEAEAVNSDGFVFDLVLANRGLVKCFSKEKTSFEIFAATFGHKCLLDKFRHDYFGSEEVVNDLKRH